MVFVARRRTVRATAAGVLGLCALLSHTSSNTAQETARQQVCDDTCRCPDQHKCAANNGLCEEAAAVSLQLTEGTYNKDNGCVAGHCCAPHTDGSDCIAEGYTACQLANVAQQATEQTEGAHAPSFGKYIYFSYFVLGYLYVKGRLPVIEGVVTPRQMRAAQKRRLDIKAYRVHRRVYIACANGFAVLILVSLIPVHWRWLVPVPVLLAVAVNLCFPEKFRPVWQRILRVRQIAPADTTQQLQPANADNPASADADHSALVTATPVVLGPTHVSRVVSGGAHEPIVVQSDLAVSSFIHSVQTVTAVEDEVCGYAVPEQATQHHVEASQPEPGVSTDPQQPGTPGDQATTSISNPLSQGIENENPAGFIEDEGGALHT